jgi:hypothetical protein
VAIGYRQAAEGASEAAGFGVLVNPLKSQRLTPSDGDRVIVVADD